MNYVKLKITGYEEESNSLLVSFASDTTASADPDSYPSFAFQPLTMWPDVNDLEQIKFNLAVAGMWHAQQQADREAFIADEQRVNALKALVGQEIQYPVSELLPSSETETVVVI